MPEGDSIHRAARRVGAALVGSEIRSIEMPQPRHSRDRWAERLAGRDVRSVDAHGKHLFLRFDGDLTLHSHLRMGGAWGVYPRGGRWHRAARRAWLVIRTDEHEVVQFDGPVLVLAPEFDEHAFLRRLRDDDPTRGIGDALLDQRIVSGIGTVWKSEGCFLAGVSPWRRLANVSDEEVLYIVREVRPLMMRSVEGNADRRRWVFDRSGLPCRRCSTRVRFRGQGDDNRNTFWCPECQR